jgi:hypothetical protein
MDWGDQLLVSFRAWSEDEIKPGADGHVVQPDGINAGIIDQGGGYHQTDGTYFYDRSFLVPLRSLPVGLYSISFIAADAGFVFSVATAETLYIKVEQNQYPRPPALPTPVNIPLPTHAEMRHLLSTINRASGHLEVPPANVKPKKDHPRLDGRAPIPLEVAMAIPIRGQKPAATPQQRAPTVLPKHHANS